VKTAADVSVFRQKPEQQKRLLLSGSKDFVVALRGTGLAGCAVTGVLSVQNSHAKLLTNNAELLVVEGVLSRELIRNVCCGLHALQ